MQPVPFVAVLAADAREVRARALRSPLERTVVDELAGHRVVAVALRLEAQRADHLRVTRVAAFAHVDVASGEPQRVVRLDARRGLRLVRLHEERRDLREAAERNHERDQDSKEPGVLLDRCEVTVLKLHRTAPRSSIARTAAEARGSGSGSP